MPLQQSEIFKRSAKPWPAGELIVQPGGGHSWWPGILNQYEAVMPGSTVLEEVVPAAI